MPRVAGIVPGRRRSQNHGRDRLHVKQAERLGERNVVVVLDLPKIDEALRVQAGAAGMLGVAAMADMRAAGNRR
jgi:hypothetical protein